MIRRRPRSSRVVVPARVQRRLLWQSWWAEGGPAGGDRIRVMNIPPKAAAAMVEEDLVAVSKNENRDHMFPLPIVLCQSNPCPAVLLRVA